MNRKDQLRQLLADTTKPALAKLERRVYMLPSEMVDRVIAYAAERRLLTEVAAVRELLEIGLAAKERIP